MLKHIITRNKANRRLNAKNERKEKERYKTNTSKKSSSSLIFDRSPLVKSITIQ